MFGYILILLIGFVSDASAVLNPHNQKISWMMGKWRSEFSGKIFWPTVPTMTFGEELVVLEAPMAKSNSAQFLNFSARAWSHSTKDHFHDEWGFLTVDPNGNATLMTTGNNGFTTYEVGTVQTNKLVLTLKDIGRISFSRDLPVEDLRRTFIKHDDTYMEQILEMRTATHPKQGYLEHTRVIYTKQKAFSAGYHWINLPLGMISAYGHEAGKPLECLSIAVVLEKEQFIDANGLQAYRVGFKVGGGIDQDPSRAPYKYPDMGIYITQIDPDSPAEKAGLRQHDKILQVNGHDFTMLTHEKSVKYIKKYPVLHMLVARREIAP